MDNAVALVQAYLRVNGYFTVVEYPVLEVGGRGAYRTATDVDVLAVRFPGAGMLVPAPGRKGHGDEEHSVVDPVLGVPAERQDMLIGEVKEGRAELNAAATNPAVLRTVLVRFGCCPREDAPALVVRLLQDGSAQLPDGHRLRLVAFGSIVDSSDASGGPTRYTRIALGHVVQFLQAYLRDHWEVLRHADSKDPAFGFLVTLEKALRALARAEDNPAAARAAAQ